MISTLLYTLTFIIGVIVGLHLQVRFDLGRRPHMFHHNLGDPVIIPRRPALAVIAVVMVICVVAMTTWWRAGEALNRSTRADENSARVRDCLENSLSTLTAVLTTRARLADAQRKLDERRNDLTRRADAVSRDDRQLTRDLFAHAVDSPPLSAEEKTALLAQFIRASARIQGRQDAVDADYDKVVLEQVVVDAARNATKIPSYPDGKCAAEAAR